MFGTDGMRGVANQHPMTAEVSLSLGRALVHLLGKGHKSKCLIGKDTRRSGYMLEMALASGICSMGGDVLLIGPMPTPGIAFLTRAMRADVGIVISASHNPFQDNGIKIFCRHGFKLPDDHEEKLETIMLSGEIDNLRPTREAIGRASRIEDSKGRYIEFVKSTFPSDLTLEGLKVVVDCAHGATYHIAPVVLEELGAQVIVMGDKPNGYNINDHVGAVYPGEMARRVRETGADIGIALDGDGDRVIIADEAGREIEGDAVLAVCAEDLLRRGKLPQNTLVATVMSNQGVDDYLEPLGGKVIRSRVGDRYVVETMRAGGYAFGGESSGHIVFLEHSTTGDGIIAALQIMALMRKSEKKISELVSGFQPYPQILKSLKISEKKSLESFADLQKMIRDFEGDLGKKGRLYVRYSGTEPVVRIMVEGRDSKVIEKMAGDLTTCLQRNLGLHP